HSSMARLAASRRRLRSETMLSAGAFGLPLNGPAERRSVHEKKLVQVHDRVTQVGDRRALQEAAQSGALGFVWGSAKSQPERMRHNRIPIVAGFALHPPRELPGDALHQAAAQ